MGAFESWENREPNARSAASTGALERGGRRQWRRQSSGSMAKSAVGEKRRRELRGKVKKLTLMLMEKTARPGMQ